MEKQGFGLEGSKRLLNLVFSVIVVLMADANPKY